MSASPARRSSRRFSIPGVKRRQSHYQIRSQRPRWVLRMQASMWRMLMGIGMYLHRLAPPRPPRPNFTFNIPSTVSTTPGVIALHFYVPKDYETQKRLYFSPDGDNIQQESTSRRAVSGSLHAIGNSIRRRNDQTRKWGGYPVIINFHGGGFTLGTARDDARWCATAVDECNAIVVSVDYRLAPEYPFPTAVEDGVDAVLYIHKHAAELGIDVNKIALSGFSSGGNMAFSVPLRLYDHLDDSHPEEDREGFFRASGDSSTLWSDRSNPSSSSTKLFPDLKGQSSSFPDSDDELSPTRGGKEFGPTDTQPNDVKSPTKTNVTFVTPKEIQPQSVRIRCIIPWYPSLDYTRTREYRRATCKRADQELPALFTDLFDDSYLHPPKDVSLSSPYLSPGVAASSHLRNALPQDIIMHTCEWDMLLEESEEFLERLRSDEIGKNVVYTMVPGVPHGWDKAPNPLKPTPGVREYYLGACREIRRVMQVEGPAPERESSDGIVTAARRSSRQIVR